MVEKDSKQAAEDLVLIRQKIDAVDKQIQELINERARYAKQIGEAKMEGNGDSPVDFYRPEREAQILRGVVGRNDGPLKDEEIMRLFREIMSVCLAHEEPVKVGYLGPEGTFTQSAVQKHFGLSVRLLPLTTIEEVFREVESGTADFGVVPIENTTEGTVNHTLDIFMNSPLNICGEVELRIRQHLLCAMDSLEKVDRVCAHPQSLAQCRAWLREFLPGAEQIPVSSNAEGARRASEEPGTAAIAGDAAADVYNLAILVGDIEDRPDNTTRFMVIGRTQFPPSGDDRTSLLVSTVHTEDAGALQNLLQPLAEDNINMTRIESRPSHQRKWHYVFFIDIDGHAEEEHIARALSHLEKGAQLFRVLGSYPKAVI
ncbi:MAG: prephenate dehydratase [Chromatiales bacterium]|jgi:chorismate mutase/prephenate dehydratase|nr:prephenate dehydratase [Chromatiales bacterium]MDP6151257.1 prephenate dehydratase [Gammaproteobacteria bacterium]HJP05083.1 prephenate dehydratase [Gammaproteobacteria bacterium]